MTQASNRLAGGAPMEAVSLDVLIACINRTTAETFNAHGIEIAIGLASVYSNFVASTFSDLGYTNPKSVLRDGESFLMVGRIFSRENGIGCEQSREVRFELRKRMAFRGVDTDLSGISASLRECRSEASRRLNRSLSTVERQELKFRNALLKWVIFDTQTGQFCRHPFYGNALLLSLDQ